MTNDPRLPTDPRPPDPADRLLDDAVAASRRGPSAQESAAARARVAARLFGAEPRAGSPCETLRSELPALVAGTLPEDRASLVADHCSECIACRKEMLAFRDGRPAAPAPVPAPPAASVGRRRVRAVAFLAAAAATLAAAFLGLKLAGPGHADVATVAEVRGQLIDGRTGLPLPEGATVAEGLAVRTARGSRAVLALPDGSRLELNERAQAAFTTTGESLTVDLDRGDVIFEAAKRKDRNLFVRTDDCTVAVKGTVFTVRHGLKGSRVGVLEGSVHVDRPGSHEELGPGEQASTDPSMQPQPLDEQVAWSLDSSRWSALLSEIDAAAAAVERNHVPREPRFESAILAAMPDTTVLFAAVPNDGELGALASEISDRVASNPQLRDWWEGQLDPASKDAANFARLLDTLRRLSDSLGEEIVFALVETGGLQAPPMPLLAAGVRDEAELRQLVADFAPEGHAVRFATAEDLAMEPAGMLREPLIVLHAGHVLVGPSADALRSVVAGFDQGASHETRFLAGLEGRYDEGAEILIAADLGRTVARRAEAAATREQDRGNAEPSRIVEALGIPDVDQFVLTAGENDPGTALLSFNEARSGVSAWLAEPGPMGSLQFVTSSSPLAVAALFQDPARMLADVESMLPAGKLDELVKTLAGESGVDMREDLVGSLGGEMALALDGPLLPQPSWKLILEVDDPARFEAALEALAAHATEAAREAGTPLQGPLVRETRTTEGPARAIRVGAIEVHYALRDGYFVAVPNLQLLEAALQASARGTSLATSERLVKLLPGGADDRLSLVAWQDMTGALGDLGSGSAAGFLPADAAPLLAAASSGPSVAWGRASDRAIAFGVASPDGGLGGGLATLLRRHVVEALSRQALTSRSGAGEDAATPRVE